MTRARWAVPLLLAALAAACIPGATGLEGSVEQAGTPVAGVFVEAFDRSPDGVAAAVASATSDSLGRFALSLPRGRYWVTAKKKPQGSTGEGMLYGALPAPVSLSSGTTRLPVLSLVDSSGEGAGGSGTPVTGRVLVAGKPRAGAFVYLYPGGRKRGPGYAAKTRSGGEGSFRLLAPPGRYHLVARLRGDGESMGTLSAGDMVGEAGTAIVLGGQGVDAGSVVLRPLDAKLLGSREWAAGEGGLELVGRVTDEQGRPVAGVHAFLYPDHRMVGKPSSLSAPTGKDGRYRLAVPGAGSWYLGARSRYGGPVEPGEMMGVFEVEGQRAPVTVAFGPAPGPADIVVKEAW